MIIYFNQTTKMASAIKTSMLNPRYLHSNSTTHTWVFSAIAELIDNACDTDVCARDLWIDQEEIKGTKCLTFVDNGSGMTRDKLHKMLSFGFNEKEDQGKWKAIGQYGNGFKSGSMRLGNDAVVITRCVQSMSVGFLSQTYLKKVGAKEVFVPMVTWDITPRGLTRKDSPENKSSMKVILNFSPIKSEEELTKQLDEKLGPKMPGTKIIIYNLKRDNANNLELDFESDVKDIRNPETAAMDQSVNERSRTAAVNTPEYRRSLRKYCSILYMKPRMKIFLRNVKVKAKWIPRELSKPVEVSYNPNWAETRLGVTLTYGFTKDKSKNAPYGLMLYHHSRLIQAYKKIGCQNKASGEGAGVICVVEADFLEPIHNKQDFNETGIYRSLINNASKKLKDYLDEKGKSKPSSSEPSPSPSEESEECWNWVQCDNCLSWRRLPQGYSADSSEDWVCYNNPDPLFNRCEIPEELEGDDEGIVTPKLTCKKAAKKEKSEIKKQAKQEEKKKAETDEASKKSEKEKEASIKAKNEQMEESVNKMARTSLKQREDASEKRLKALEKEKKKMAYINPVKAAEEKEKGNEFFRQGMYKEAFKHYSEALKRNPHDAEIVSCKDACFKKVREYIAALEECDSSLSLDSKLIKPYLQGRNICKAMTYGQRLAATTASGQGLQTSRNQTCIEIQSNQAQIQKSSLLDLSLKRNATDTDGCDADPSPAKRLVNRSLFEDKGTSLLSNTGTGSNKTDATAQPSVTNSSFNISSAYVPPRTTSSFNISCTYVPPRTNSSSKISCTNSTNATSSSLCVAPGTGDKISTPTIGCTYVPSSTKSTHPTYTSLDSPGIRSKISTSTIGCTYATPGTNTTNLMSSSLGVSPGTGSQITTSMIGSMPVSSGTKGTAGIKLSHSVSTTVTSGSSGMVSILNQKKGNEGRQNIANESSKVGVGIKQEQGELEGMLLEMDEVLKYSNEQMVSQIKIEPKADTALWNETSPQEVELLKTSLAQKSKELDDTKKALVSLRRNVSALLRIYKPHVGQVPLDSIDAFVAKIVN